MTPEAPTLLALEAREAGYKARIEELEANERAFEAILGKRTYNEVAAHIQEMEGALRELFDQPTENPLRMTPEQRGKLWAAHARARGVLNREAGS